MVKNLRCLLHCSLFALLPMTAGAAGTYYNYNGTVQRNYGGPYSDSVYSSGAINAYSDNNTCYGAGCNGNKADAKNTVVQNKKSQNRSNTSAGRASQQDSRFKLNAGLSHQFASWNFDMKTAGSKLHYNNLRWNVFDASMNYDFNVANTALRLDVGGQYGVQFGDTNMVDDDVTGGGYFLRGYYVDLDEPSDGIADQVWVQQGHALSVGTSNGGDMMGVYAGIGLPNVWKVGTFKVTPSVGYRYFKYKLETKQNYGLSLDTVSGADNYCQTLGDETQCLPLLVFVDGNNSALLGVVDPVYMENDGSINTDGNGRLYTLSYVTIPSGAQYVETENMYYYYQNGISHSYEVEWAGPYLALDMEYDISAIDAVNARLEFGLPAYTATADQPYRPDWQHPKSLEDKASIGDAYHFGLGANWAHALTDSVMLSLGVTFDYYNVGKADATSYLSADYYTTRYYDPAVAENDDLVTHYGNTNYQTWDELDMNTYLDNLETIATIDSLRAAGWQQKSSGEVESIYKSMGIRLGVQARF